MSLDKLIISELCMYFVETSDWSSDASGLNPESDSYDGYRLIRIPFWQLGIRWFGKREAKKSLSRDIEALVDNFFAQSDLHEGQSLGYIESLGTRYNLTIWDINRRDITMHRSYDSGGEEISVKGDYGVVDKSWEPNLVYEFKTGFLVNFRLGFTRAIEEGVSSFATVRDGI